MMAYYPLGGAAMMDKEDCLLKNPTIMEIAENHHKTPAQVLIRWCIQRGVVAIPKSVHMNRVEENGQVFDFELSEDEMQTIRKMDRHQRFCPMGVFLSSKDTRENYYDFEDSYDCLLKDNLIVFVISTNSIVYLKKIYLITLIIKNYNSLCDLYSLPRLF